ncbi:hypothetical protein PCANC_06998 [Puccinia coronata f. sp. avenae]|uniref:Reverse transcriptase n=1 Tax=Puccinia coronata f. sp. avenae TaxID=200324 RepID=A0A2N5UZM2_9BASI|nr:hypothetical protein PCANC_06998 [Puccinia coronata f. sp. avenae]
MACKFAAQGLPPRHQYEFCVELMPDAVPQASLIIPLSPAKNKALDTLINDGISNGTICQTTSPWAAPNKYLLPLTMDLVDSLLDADTFTKIDLQNAYGNLRVAEGNEDKLAFICRSGQFAPLTMPFGPTGAPGYFQYFMQDILLGSIGKDVVAYLDDIMIYTKKGLNHEDAVQTVLDTLSKHTLWLNPEKCEFSKGEVEYLGLLISCNRIQMDPPKVKAVSNWPPPHNLTELQQFIGFAKFYWWFIKQFSHVVRPLHNLTKKDSSFNWTPECQSAFNNLKKSFTTAPILKFANLYRPFVLECDCSDFALDAVLSQDYAIFDKELLAIVTSFKEWRNYLEGSPHQLHTIVYTDHRHEAVCPDALSQQPDLAPNKAKKLTFGQLLRPDNIRPDTFTAITEFEACFVNESVDLNNTDYWFDVDILGSEDIPDLNSIAALSCPTKPSLTDQDPLRQARQLDKEMCASKDSLGFSVPELRSTLAPPQYAKMIEGVRRTVPEDNDYTLLMDLVTLPASRRLNPKLSRHHNSKLAGHPGRAKTLSLIQHSFTWPSIKHMVNQYVDGCNACQQSKAFTQKPLGLLQPLPIPAGLWTDISYDLITDLPVLEGYDSILTVVNQLTKMANFLPCKKTLNAKDLARLMLGNVWKLHGTLKTIVSDQGSVFISQITRKLDRQLGIWLHPSTAFHPQTNGQSEITNKAVEQYLRVFVSYHQDDWVQLLPTAEFAHNNHNHLSTGMSPFKANYGFNLSYGRVPLAKQCLPVVEERLKKLSEVQDELKECLQCAQESMKSQFDQHARANPGWKTGNEVWLNSRNISTTRPCPKLDNQWLGTFSISKVISSSAYELNLPPSLRGIHPVFHVSMLQRHQPDLISGRRPPAPNPIIIEGTNEWEVEDILDCRVRGKQCQYLVSWKGFGPQENSWEPDQNLDNCKELVDQFNARFPEAASKHQRC